MLGFHAISAAPISALRVTGAIAGTAAVTFSQTGDVTNQGDLSGTSAITLSQTGNLLGAGALTGPSTITLSQSATISAMFSLLGSSSFSVLATGSLTNANAGEIWLNPDGLYVLYGSAQGETKPAYASDTTPYRQGKLRYDRPNHQKYRVVG